jgi:hypothetical protein
VDLQLFNRPHPDGRGLRGRKGEVADEDRELGTELRIEGSPDSSVELGIVEVAADITVLKTGYGELALLGGGSKLGLGNYWLSLVAGRLFHGAPSRSI